MNGRGCDVIARTYHFLDALITPAPASPPATPHGYPLHEGVCVPTRAARARARVSVCVCARETARVWARQSGVRL